FANRHLANGRPCRLMQHLIECRCRYLGLFGTAMIDPSACSDLSHIRLAHLSVRRLLKSSVDLRQHLLHEVLRIPLAIRKLVAMIFKSGKKGLQPREECFVHVMPPITSNGLRVVISTSPR